MNRFERWFLRRIFARQVRQGPDHPKRIAELYRMIDEAVKSEFTEDNTPTRRSYLQEWFDIGRAQ